MSEKDNQLPLKHQLNRSIGCLIALQQMDAVGKDDSLMLIQLDAAIGGLKKLRRKLYPQYIETELLRNIKRILLLIPTDGCDYKGLIHLQESYSKLTVFRQAKLLDILRKCYPED